MANETYTERAVAAATDTPPSTVRQWRHRGTLPAERKGFTLHEACFVALISTLTRQGVQHRLAVKVARKAAEKLSVPAVGAMTFELSGGATIKVDLAGLRTKLLERLREEVPPDA